ncbi:MAG TPA: Gfo/Idh/MocA family oxidoreductase [Polyangiaceae bacterium]|nr:Gfo/Idh/MocA family oxidoreductase [Polyangiaceae bacterium]
MSLLPLRVGLVGFGLAGRTLHAPFIQVLSGLELTAVVTSREVDAKLFPSARRVASFEELLKMDSIDLVVIASPNAFHVRQCLAALRAGKHVVCDKPLAETAVEVEQLMRVSEQVGRLLIPFQNRRWDGDFRTLQQLLSAGRLGQVHAFYSSWSKYQGMPRVRVAWKAEPAFNGPLWDLCPHLIDQAIVLWGKPQRLLGRIAQHRAQGTVHDYVHLTLLYSDGLEAVLEVDQLDAFGGRRLVLRGTRGSFDKRGFDPQESELSAGRFPDTADWGREAAEGWGALRLLQGDQLIEERVETLPGDHRLFYHGVCAALAGGQPSPVALSDVLLQIRIIEAALKSQETQQIVHL